MLFPDGDMPRVFVSRKSLPHLKDKSIGSKNKTSWVQIPAFACANCISSDTALCFAHL